MMGATRPYSYPSSPLAVPSTSCPATVSPHIGPHRSCCVGSVTTVGGTQGIPEIAATFSGGGFSNYVSLETSCRSSSATTVLTWKKIKFARPSWQNETVQNYLNSLPSGQYQGLYNPYVSFLSPSSNSLRLTWFSSCPCPSHSAGRVRPSIPSSPYQPLTFHSQAYPDVSAQSRRFVIIYTGLPALISGTSASAPAFAGIVALLNDASIAAGKPPLGFLNPMLYSIGVAGLNDITEGNAPGCGTPGFNVSIIYLSFFFFWMELTH